MYLTFFGTGGGIPTLQRNATSIAFTHSINGETWLFDCGEGTQHQFMRSALKAKNLKKIFITHLHGDHIFGLPGLLTSRSMLGLVNLFTIYGPKGIKSFIKNALLVSNSYIKFPLEIIEIEAGTILDNGKFHVTAWPLNHVIECFGYRIEQYEQPGCLDAIRLKKDGIPQGPLYKQLKQKKSIKLNDGRIINGADYLSPAIKGKILAIFGDTAPTDIALQLAANVDIMIHEATLEGSMVKKANLRGHSTTIQAAKLAKKAGVQYMIATHFSARYSIKDMHRLLTECISIFPNIELAYDLMVFHI